jgi:microcystin-dependent protein
MITLAGHPFTLGTQKLPLETATYISDLNVANPAHTDGLSQADSHMRLIKSVVKATFPNFTAAALASTQAQLDTAAAAAAGTGYSRIPMGTALLPGLTPIGDTNTGLLSPAADQLAFSLGGTQVLLMGGSALVTSLGVAAAAYTTAGAYSGGTGQLVPIGAVLEWYDDVLPTEGGYAWANGQIIASANTVCPVLLARWGTRFGGNGTTTMGVPDRRDTVGVGKSTMGGVAARALQTLTNTVLGTLFGEANHALLTAELASHYHAAAIYDPTHTHTATTNTTSGSGVTGGGAFPLNVTTTATNTGAAATGVRVNSSNGIDTTYSTGSGTAHNTVQPSTTCNYILRLG